MGICRRCGTMILWITMKDTGKNMPVNFDRSTIVTKEGEIKIGHIPHWITCKDAKLFKKENQVDNNDTFEKVLSAIPKCNNER